MITMQLKEKHGSGHHTMDIWRTEHGDIGICISGTNAGKDFQVDFGELTDNDISDLIAMLERAKAQRPGQVLEALIPAPGPLTAFHGGRDGDCIEPRCPQLRDNEPHATGRHCPLDNRDIGE